MIRFKQKGDFRKFNKWTERIREVVKLGDLDKYGAEGVELLKEATPKNTGKTSNSWTYTIEHTKNSIILSFHNSNIQNGENIAILLEYGHATKHGGWIEGIEYIEPSIQPLFKKIADDAWKEVMK